MCPETTTRNGNKNFEEGEIIDRQVIEMLFAEETNIGLFSPTFQIFCQPKLH
jgi:hypothetical protein